MKRWIKTVCLMLGVIMLLESSALNACAIMRPQEDSTYREKPGKTQVQEPAETTAPTEPVASEHTEPSAEPVPEETQSTKPERTEETEPARTTQVPENFYEVPEYYQTDYPDALYGNGTIASSGCSITALAMVATYMTEHVYMPDELADYFGGYIGNNMERLEYASDQLHLPWTRAKNFHDALNALKEGKVVIALMNEKSAFTDSQHYIVLAGMDVEGKVTVNDPYAPNYESWRLKDGFANGFDEDLLCWGFSGGWIYDKSEMSADPFIYEEEEVDRGECRYPGIELTDAEKTMFAKLLWLECRGEPREGQQAVAEVILNRLAADNFPNTLKSIIYAEGQFPSVDDMYKAETTQTQYEAIENAMYGPYILPKEVVFYAKFKVNDNYWGKIGDHYFCYQYGWKSEEEKPAEKTAEETVPETTEETTAETKSAD